MRRGTAFGIAVVLIAPLLGLAVPAGAAGAVPSNLFTNGGFESGLDGWTALAGGCGAAAALSYDSTTNEVYFTIPPDPTRFFAFPAYSGRAAFLNECNTPGADPGVSQTVAVTAGTTYTISGHIRTGVNSLDPGPFDSFRICVDDCVGPNKLAVLIANPAKNVWLPFSAEFTPTSGTATIFFYGEALTDSDYLIDEVRLGVKAPSPAQVTDTVATCNSVFSVGEYPSLSTVQYSTRRGLINQVNPGVFYYWAEVELGAGGGEVLNQSASGSWSRWFAQAAGSQLFTTDCQTVKNARVSTDSSGITSATGNGISEGTYYLAVKYSATILTGAAAPGTDPTYSFSSSAGAEAVELSLTRK